jgi:hypothetical protein
MNAILPSSWSKFTIAALIAVAASSNMTNLAHGQQTPPEAVKLESLHGTMITLISEHEGMPMEIWAKGKNVRSQIAAGDKKFVVIQLGDTIYSYGSGDATGSKTKFDSGLAALGLIEQIALVKSKGKKDGSQVVAGVAYDEYKYDVDAPQEEAIVLLETNTSLPKDWLSMVRNGDGPAVPARTIYRDMQANVDVPDELFELPKDVQFVEVTAAELMSTPLPTGPGVESPATTPAR